MSLDYSDLDLSRWRDYLSEVETGSLWLYPSRDGAESHVGDYHGNFIPQIPHQLIIRYTKTGEAVFDPFLGSGTTLIECRRLGRHGAGVELNPEVAQVADRRIKEASNRFQVKTRVFKGNCLDDDILSTVRDFLGELGREAAQLLILHPPYSNIISFGKRKGDLSNVKSDNEFLDLFCQMVEKTMPILEDGRYMGLVIGDKYSGGELVPLGFECMEICRKAGYKLKSIVVKNIEGNEKGKGKRSNLWKYRALAGGFYIFKHEYVMIFKK